jgi:hypothetical protein
MTLESKLCTMCRENRPLTDYYTFKSGPSTGKYRARCRYCSYAVTKKWVEDNPERFKDSHSRSTLKRRYGVTKEWKESEILKGCRICGSKDTKLVIDHCHTTGKTRAVICTYCNNSLGVVEDLDRMEKYFRYLKETGSPSLESLRSLLNE